MKCSPALDPARGQQPRCLPSGGGEEQFNTKTPPRLPRWKFTGAEVAATGEVTMLGYCSPHRRKPQKSQTHPGVSSTQSRINHSKHPASERFKNNRRPIPGLRVGRGGAKGKTLKEKKPIDSNAF